MLLEKHFLVFGDDFPRARLSFMSLSRCVSPSFPSSNIAQETPNDFATAQSCRFGEHDHETYAAKKQATEKLARTTDLVVPHRVWWQHAGHEKSTPHRAHPKNKDPHQQHEKD
jgi:hypothetical protein